MDTFCITIDGPVPRAISHDELDLLLEIMPPELVQLIGGIDAPELAGKLEQD